ncbi:hypothetical protein [Magnetofaba australis]|uniref:Uncharacterized protein n=1 Tax=Magnetofaba australis IT-1 TaxID=1434232 RepID=A0A1Y2K4R3_9PROT|nr:hypothetical protein [Magnetofaba australis]OSM04357.1 hypothetical protein MAIT1_04252 [Magnetofaba australis IT-1]
MFKRSWDNTRRILAVLLALVASGMFWWGDYLPGAFLAGVSLVMIRPDLARVGRLFQNLFWGALLGLGVVLLLTGGWLYVAGVAAVAVYAFFKIWGVPGAGVYKKVRNFRLFPAKKKRLKLSEAWG